MSGVHSQFFPLPLFYTIPTEFRIVVDVNVARPAAAGRAMEATYISESRQGWHIFQFQLNQPQIRIIAQKIDHLAIYTIVLQYYRAL